MAKVPLFPKREVVGIFRGFSEGGLEFHADILLPYQNRFQTMPMHGQFLLVQLASDDEAVLGRITSFQSSGRLTSGPGEDFSLRAMSEDREIPEDIREQYVKYRVNIRVLGVLRNGHHEGDAKLLFVPSHRRLPHVGAKVAFPSDEVLMEISGHCDPGAQLGFFALGEFVYSGMSDALEALPWMQIKSPELQIHFDIENLVARRSFVFARAGFGKSNLIKLLFSELYRPTRERPVPTVEKRGGRRVPVGTVIFDPDGEYFWPDDKGRPGLADIPHLQDRLVVFTNREAPSDYYGSFVLSNVKLDIRRLPAASVVGIALSAERQEQQNVRKLKRLSSTKWGELVDLVHRNGFGADPKTVGDIIGAGSFNSGDPSAEALAALSNIAYIVQTLHDPRSRLLDGLLDALQAGKLCVVDISQMRGEQGLILSGLLLDHIFHHNQEHFTSKEGDTIPTIAVVEEAQSVLGQGSAGGGPYVSWFKEGRKYDLGAVLITQQPGSIPMELLSQGDNWFVFHLLSGRDLKNLQEANAHFSYDLLSSLLNEPIPGQGVFWSSVAERPYPIPFRAMAFGAGMPRFDERYDKPAASTHANIMRAHYDQEGERIAQELATIARERGQEAINLRGSSDTEDGDEYRSMIELAKLKLRKSDKMDQVRSGKGIPLAALWGTMKQFLPNRYHEDRSVWGWVTDALDEEFGPSGWDQKKRFRDNGSSYMWVEPTDSDSSQASTA